MWNDWKLGGTLLRHSAKPNLRRAHSFYDAPQAAQVTSPSQTDAMPKNKANEMLDMKNAILTRDRNQLLPSPASLPAATRLDPDCQWFPALDVIRTSEQYLIEVDLPGLDPKDIQVTAEEGILSLRGAFFSCVWLLAALTYSTALAAESPMNPPRSGQEVRPAGDELAWPREFQDNGTKVDIYEPQIEKWEGVDFETRSAVAITAAGSNAPVYGVFWMK